MATFGRKDPAPELSGGARSDARSTLGLVFACALAAAVGLALMGATSDFVLNSNEPVEVNEGAPLETPTTVAGLPQVHTPEYDRLAANGVAGMVEQGQTDALAAFYGTDDVPTLFVAATRTRKSADEDAELDAIFTSVGETVGTESRQTLDGQRYRCQQVQLPDVAPLIWVCGWSTERSTGMLMHYQAQAVTPVAAAAHEARDAIEG